MNDADLYAAGRGVKLPDDHTGTDPGAELEQLGRRVASLPCFNGDTRIATRKGERLLASLRPGDMLVTRDNGLRPVLGIGATRISHAQVLALPDIAPVQISSGSIGQDLPEREMRVGPNQSFLIPGKDSDGADRIVPARLLDDGVTGRRIRPLGMVYLHLLFESAEMILADGAWALCPDPAGMRQNLPDFKLISDSDGLPEGWPEELTAISPLDAFLRDQTTAR